MLIGTNYFSLRVNTSECMLDDEDPSFYAPSIKGLIVALGEDDEGEGVDPDDGVIVGKFKAYYMDVGAAVNACASVYDMFDARSSTFDYYGAIFQDDRTLNFTDNLEKLFKHYAVWGNILILDRLEILPDFRGRNLGLIVLRRLIERFGAGTAYVAMKPFPLQCESRSRDQEPWDVEMQLTEFSKNTRGSTARLRRYYARLGFKAMKGTPFMFRMTGKPLPSPAELRGDVACINKKA